jgi:hypothetical protein
LFNNGPTAEQSAESDVNDPTQDQNQHYIKNWSGDVNKFKQALIKCLLAGSFYSLDKYFEWKTKDELGSYKYTVDCS